MITRTLQEMLNKDSIQRNPYYALKDRNNYAWHHYTGLNAYPEYIHLYLHRKAQRESEQAFAERCLIADPQLHFATVVDELAGMIFGNEDEAERQFSDPETTNNLGDQEINGDIANAIFNDCTGSGENWLTFWKEICIKMLVVKPIYVVVDGVTDDREATLQNVMPWDVVSFFEDKYGDLQEITIKYTESVLEKWNEPAKVKPYFIRYTLDGWFKYEDLQGNPIDSGYYDFYATSERKRKILPVFKVNLPLDREVGYLLARKANVLFNLDSVRDFAVRNVTFNLLGISGNDEQFNKTVSNLAQGSNIIQIDPESSSRHEYISPNPAMVQASTDVYKEKLEAFYSSAFKMYSDSARLQTATQIIQRAKSSLDTILLLLSDALDEAERNAMWRLTQIYNPNNPDVWGDSWVYRTKDFSAFDPDAQIAAMTNRYLGSEKIPLDENGYYQLIKQITKRDNIVMTNDSVIALAQKLAGIEDVEDDETNPMT